MKTRKEKLNKILLFLAKYLCNCFVNLYNCVMFTLLIIICVFIAILLLIYYPFYYLIYNGNNSLLELAQYIELKLNIEKIFDLLIIGLGDK